MARVLNFGYLLESPRETIKLSMPGLHSPYPILIGLRRVLSISICETNIQTKHK